MLVYPVLRAAWAALRAPHDGKRGVAPGRQKRPAGGAARTARVSDALVPGTRAVVPGLALLLALWLSLAPARAEVVDRVVAQVENQLVTDSEVRLEGVLSALDASPSPFWSRDHRTPLERLVDAAVVREMAKDVALYQPTDDEVRARLETIRGHFPDGSAWQGFLASWGLDEDGLRALLERRMVVERYLARNVEVRPADDATWLRTCDQLVDQQASHYRIRLIAPEAAP